MSEMVERVAVAMVLEEMRSRDVPEGSPVGTAARTVGRAEAVASCGRFARAAIVAVREPTDPMVKVGAPETEPDEGSDGTWEAHLTWRAMIDEALR